MKIVNNFKKYQKKILSYSNRKLFGPLLRWSFVYLKLDQRYRFLNTNSASIGHLCTDVDCFLREWKLKNFQFRGVLLANRTTVANPVLVKIWKTTPGLVVVESPIACYFFDYLRIFKESGYDCSKYCALDSQAAEVYKIRNSKDIDDVIISWPPDLLQRAHKLFKEVFPTLDVGRCVALHSRDSTFDKRIKNQNYNTQGYRNSDISSYSLILAYLNERGCVVIRIGEYSKNPLVETVSYLQIPEIEVFDRNLLELFIVSRCKVFLGSASGASDMASIWGRPVFRLNTLPYALLRPHYSAGMGIPKLLYSKDKILNAKDIFVKGYHWFRDDSQYLKHGVEVRDNDASDCIEDFAEFFEAFVLGNKILQYTLTNSPQQFRYKKLCPSDCYDLYASSLVPRNFFSKYKIV